MATTMLKGNLVNLAGRTVNVGDKAPKVIVTGKDLSDVTIGGCSDSAQLVVVVPSLDTPVCASETRKFNEKASSIAGCKTVVVSMDLPFAMGRFCSTEGIENLTVASDFRNKDFANNYGVLVADGALRGVTCRAIFVIGKDGNVCYKEIVPEITAEPNYDAALEAATTAAK
ncbi:MAG: thiol peroxidase [Campylobacterales bacterium]|nr:thiol peroxidase [Campylobacterales bacterium]